MIEGTDAVKTTCPICDGSGCGACDDLGLVDTAMADVLQDDVAFLQDMYVDALERQEVEEDSNPVQ